MSPLETTLTDHLGRTLKMPRLPQRIISLCPSQTATLVDLGVGERLVGRTHFCIHPEEAVQGLVAVGGTKKLKMERIHALKPDLIVAEKEENTKEMVEALDQDYPVFVTDVKDLATCLKMVEDLGEITGLPEAGRTIVSEIEAAMTEVKPLAEPVRCLYFIWRKPWMVAGHGTFIDDILQRCGLVNILGQERYPEVTPEQITALAPEIILLSSEPYPFAERHIGELRELLPHTRFHLVDGEAFSWYGSRMRGVTGYLNGLLEKVQNETPHCYNSCMTWINSFCNSSNPPFSADPIETSDYWLKQDDPSATQPQTPSQPQLQNPLRPAPLAYGPGYRQWRVPNQWNFLLR